MSNKLPTAREITRELIDAFSDAIGSDISVSPKSRHDISAIIESHTAAHTAGLREENTRYREALETALDLLSEGKRFNTAKVIVEALKNNEG